MKKKVCIVTGCRAEWGLFYPLAEEIRKHKDAFFLQIIATGAHLSQKFGLTYKEIENENFTINQKVKMPLAQDTNEAILKSVSVGITGISRALRFLRPDTVILLGDRFETFSAAVACLFLKIPVAHIHGGELTEGSIDDSIRHAITKMAYLHFTSTEVYRRRVIQMGEAPSRVFTVGALGIDNIKNTKLLNRTEFERRTGFKLGKKNIIVTFNPSTSEEEEVSFLQFSNLLKVIDKFKDVKVIFTKPNPDIYSDSLSRLIGDYVSKNACRCVAFTSMGRELYLSALQFMDAAAGNSSSGIIETPSFGIPTVNIGYRQEGRLKPTSVIDTSADVLSIYRAFRKAFSSHFRQHCLKARNPYGNGRAALKIVSALKRGDFSECRKKFYDTNNMMHNRIRYD